MNSSENFLDVGDIIEDIATGRRAIVLGTQDGSIVLWVNSELILQTPPHPDENYIKSFFNSYYIVGHSVDLELRLHTLKYIDASPPETMPS